jgi:pilus assembly protein Flp/PilA
MVTVHRRRKAKDSSTATCTQELPMTNLVARFVKDESGATAIEYALIAAGISLAIIAAVQGLGTTLMSKFTSIDNAIK